jgi:hypothetical protein
MRDSDMVSPTANWPTIRSTGPSWRRSSTCGSKGCAWVGVLPYDEAFAEAVNSVPAVVTSSHSYELPHVDSVVNDDEDGTRQATEHLIGLGHQRIAHIGGGPDGVAQARLRQHQPRRGRPPVVVVGRPAQHRHLGTGLDHPPACRLASQTGVP